MATRLPSESFYAPTAQPLSPEDITKIESGSGWRKAADGTPTSEQNGSLQPYTWRGLYPNPGIADAIKRGDPMVESGQMRQARYVASLEWELREPKKATPQEQAFIAHIVASFDALRGGGLAGLIRRVMSRETYGFSLHELAYAIDPRSGLWYLRLAKPIMPWCLYRTIIDPEGLPVAIIVRDEQGVHPPIPMSKLLVSVRDDMLCNIEGTSALRPLYYYVQSKKDLLASDAASCERAGRGTCVFKAPSDVQVGSKEYTAMEGVAANWQSGGQAYIVLPGGWEQMWDYGGAIPDPVSRIGMIDQAIARSSDDELRGLGENKYGARAVGQELRASNQDQLTGVLEELANEFTSQLVMPLYDLNGVDRGPLNSRMGKMTSGGFYDPEKLTQVRAFCQQTSADIPPVLELRDKDKIKIRRWLGLDE